MSYEAYNVFATAVKNEISRLDYEQQLGILTIVVEAMNQKKRTKSDKEETLQMFNELSGCIKGKTHIDAKKNILITLMSGMECENAFFT